MRPFNNTFIGTHDEWNRELGGWGSSQTLGGLDQSFRLKGRGESRVRTADPLDVLTTSDSGDSIWPQRDTFRRGEWSSDTWSPGRHTDEEWSRVRVSVPVGPKIRRHTTKGSPTDGWRVSSEVPGDVMVKVCGQSVIKFDPPGFNHL